MPAVSTVSPLSASSGLNPASFVPERCFFLLILVHV